MKTIAIVVSRFNSFVTDKLLEGALSEAEKHGMSDNVEVFEVPGAIELIFAANQLIKTNKYAAVIIFGCVIKGETDHYDYVCMQVSNGTQNLIANYDVPVVFGVLTTYNKQQALERVTEDSHTGRYSFNAAVEMMELCKKLSK